MGRKLRWVVAAGVLWAVSACGPGSSTHGLARIDPGGGVSYLSLPDASLGKGATKDAAGHVVSTGGVAAYDGP